MSPVPLSFDEANNLLWIDGEWFQLAQPPTYQNQAVLAGKVTFGDYTRDSDPNASSKIWTDFTGGIGIENVREGSDEGSYWYGVADVMTPYQIALPRETLKLDDVSLPLGDYKNTFYATDGTTFWAWNESTLSFSNTTHTVGATPVGEGTSFDGDFWVPLGANGIAQYDGLGNATVDTAHKAIDCIDFDGHLYIVTTDRKFERYDGSVWSTIETFLWDDTPRHLVIYMNRLEDDILYIATNKGLIAYDKDNGALIRTRMQVPPHQDNGLGVTTWRAGEDLYYSAGMQVYQYNVGSTTPMGPGGKEGVPSRIRGRITDFAPSFNSLFALVEGAPEVVPAEEGVILEEGSYYDDALYGSETVAIATVMEYNGRGWHPCWEAETATGNVTWITSSATSSHHRVFWGYGDAMYTQKLSRTSTPVRQRIRAGEARFQPRGFVETGWFDGNMFGYIKTASHLIVNTTASDEDAWFAIDYGVDDEDDGYPHALTGPVYTSQRIVLPFGVQSLQSPAISGDFAYGLPFGRIKFRVRMETSTPTKSALIDSLALKFVKGGDAAGLWQCQIVIDNGAEEILGRTPTQIVNHLESLVTAKQFSAVSLGRYDRPVFRGMITAERGVDQAGNDQGTTRTISIVEYPLAGFDGKPAGYVFTP